ncbi:MAG TPA: hypothetical protein VE175_00370 [Woeseiaceae bacterium]|nr:hypothetical protein [Woeseiaceae bacterium]
MADKLLKSTNPYLRSAKANARIMRIRSIASSTAIETGESIKAIERKLTSKPPYRHRVTLA